MSYGSQSRDSESHNAWLVSALRSRVDGVREAIDDDDAAEAFLLSRQILADSYRMVRESQDSQHILNIEEVVQELLRDILKVDCLGDYRRGNASLIDHRFSSVN